MSQPIYHIALTDAPDKAEREQVEEGLVAFNRAVSPEYATLDAADKPLPLDVYVRDAQDVSLGGLVGVTFWGWLTIELLWLDERVRGQGFGAQLIAAAEAEARQRGCTRSRVTTYSFQARAFYEKQGYRVIGQLDDFPPGGAHYSLRKDLAGFRM